jgi:uncharacterized protein (TIGR00255 family)
MTIASMTGFARQNGHAAPFRWSWEVKTVNSKGLDLRLRLPPGFDALDIPARAAIAKVVTRGACQANLTILRESLAAAPRINHALLAQLLEIVSAAPLPKNVGPATLDGLLALRGVIETGEDEDESALAGAQAAVLRGLETALADLRCMRAAEGAALEKIFITRLDAIEKLARAADACPTRKPEAVREKLCAALRQLTDLGRFDEARLHQEAILLAAKADIREELDRLFAHVKAARKLLADGGAIGRRLDFLAQEFGRETNTLCAKSNDSALTAIGLDLKVEVEQLREQAQNIE